MADRIAKLSIDNATYYELKAPVAAPGFFISALDESVKIYFKFAFAETNVDSILPGVKMPFKKLLSANRDNRWYAVGDTIGWFTTESGSAFVIATPEAIF